MNLTNQKRLHNCDYVNSLWISPFINKRFWDSFQNHLITNNFIKKIQKQEKVIELLNSQMLDNRNYLTLKDLDQDQKDPVFEYLKKLVPSVFQDGVLNFDLLKQHLNPDEKIIQNTRNFLGLDWATKEKAKLEYSKNIKNKTLVPDLNQSLNFNQAKNIIIEGDNLEALKILQSAYQEKVDVIYIDPPYNTGNDFVYNDNFKQNSYEYKIANGLIDEEGLKTTTNQKTNPRLHNNWLDMIYPRLKVARNLLKEDGLIFISIDDNEQARLKLICDEIFGEDNFVSTLIWQKLGGPKNNTKHISNIHDYVLVFAKSKEYLKIKLLNRNQEQLKSYKNPDNDPRGLWQRTNLLSPKYTEKNYYDIVFNGQVYKPSPGHSWMFPKDKLEELILDKRVYSEGKMLRRKMFLSEAKEGVSPVSVLSKDLVGISQTGTEMMTKLFNEKAVFDFPKPVLLLKYLINLHTDKNALVLDFFAGSGTTAQAVMELNQEDGGNRKYVLVQLSEPIENNPEFKTICDITRARIIRSIEKYQYNDLGFKYFKIGKSNFPIWQLKNDDSDETIESQLNVFESLNLDQNYESMLHELMIKQGMRLDENIQLHQIDDYQFWTDEFFDYLFFLKPTNPNNLFPIVKQIIENKEQEGKTRIFINEAYFDDLKGDEIKLNLAEQISQYKKEFKKEIQLVVV